MALTALAGRTAGVEVTADGVIARRYWGRTEFIPWEDARLLEASGMWLRMEYRLYGSHAVAHWRDQTLGFPVNYPTKIPAFRPLGSQGTDIPAHCGAIRAAITSHTGLVPRSLSPDLIRLYGHARLKPQTRRGWKRQSAQHP